MKVGMNLLLWTGAVSKEHYPLLKQIKSWGFDGVEVPMFDVKASPWSELATVLDGEGLDRTVVAVLPTGANMISELPYERQAALDFLRGCIDASVALGAELLCGPICAPVGKLVGRCRNDAEWNWAVEGLRSLAEHANGSRTPISVEPLNRFETYFINCVADAADLVRTVGGDRIGILYDTFHANIEEKNIDGAIRAAGKTINHVHVSANDRATPGEDHVDYATTFRALKAIGYDGWLMIEAFGMWLPDLAAATCIWRKMAPSEEHIAREGCKFIRNAWNG